MKGSREGDPLKTVRKGRGARRGEEEEEREDKEAHCGVMVFSLGL